MWALTGEVVGLVYYGLFAALLLWLLFRAPLPRRVSSRRVPRWMAVAAFAAVGVGVLVGITYELFIKDERPPCPCGVPGCPEPPACDLIHEEYVRAIEAKKAKLR
jgi:hypothetical protein